MLNMNFTNNELNTPIDEMEADAFEYIQSQVEDDCHLKHMDICYMDEMEIASIVAEYNDLLDY